MGHCSFGGSAWGVDITFNDDFLLVTLFASECCGGGPIRKFIEIVIVLSNIFGCIVVFCPFSWPRISSSVLT